MTEDLGAPGFDARRAAARQRLDAIDPAKNPSEHGGDDPYRRGWFNAVYDLARDDPACIPWADLQPHPLLAQWLAGRDLTGLRALDIGCGLGDNAQALAAAGAQTAAFDLSHKAIVWAKRRFPDSAVEYRAADLFAPPADWREKFDLVHECYTLQALPSTVLPLAAAALAHFLAPGGALLVIARARPNPQAPAGPPWPLSRQDMEAIAANGLSLDSIEMIDPPGEPPHWRALYRRVA